MPEVSFSNNVLYIEKCNPIGSNLPDNECNDATIPYNKPLSLIFRVYLNDPNIGNPSTEVTSAMGFSGIINSACPYDQVSFATALT